MATNTMELIKDVWTKVLTNVTYSGQIFIIDLESEPVAYLVALVDTGDPAPVLTFDGGIKFENSFSPANSIASDYYIMPKNSNGKVVILT